MNKNIGIDIEAMKSMKDFISVYEEVAANNMRRIRDAVVKRRGFLDDLTKLYNEIKISYKKEVAMVMSKKKNPQSSQFNLLKKNDGTVCVFFSTNASFYGDIVRDTYDLFREYLEREKSDAVIIGKIGKRLFEEDNPGVKYKYFDFPDTTMDTALLKPIIFYVAGYEKIIIFHPKFQTLVKQTPTAFVISESKIDNQESAAQTKYIFEPSLETIIEYFEKEIFSSIFEQTVHESQLSKFASRMVTLDAATENIKKRLKQAEFRERLLLHQSRNKQQLNSIARLVVWARRR